MATLRFSAIILLFAVMISLQSTEAQDVGEPIASTETADVGQLTPSTETADVGESSLRIIQPTQASEVLELGKPYSIHKIVMVAERWGQTGMYAYKMQEHRIEKVGEFNLAESLVQKDKNRYMCSVTSTGQTTNDRLLVWDYFNNAWSIYVGIAASAMATFYVDEVDEQPHEWS